MLRWGLFLFKSVRSSRDSGCRIMGDSFIGSSKDYRTKDFGCSCNQRI